MDLPGVEGGGGGRAIVHGLTPGLPKSGPWRGIAIWIAAAGLILVFSGCAGLACQQTLITVARKEERGRLETVPRGYTTETGRLEELRRPEIVRDYWVQDATGTWHRVSLEQYRAAEVGRPLELCR
jgi:hypothetical protein